MGEIKNGSCLNMSAYGNEVKVLKCIMKLSRLMGVTIDNLVSIIYNGVIGHTQGCCDHEWGPNGMTDGEARKALEADEWFSIRVRCVKCGAIGGWWCPKSPDHECDYSYDENKDDDEYICDYCGMSPEREWSRL